MYAIRSYYGLAGSTFRLFLKGIQQIPLHAVGIGRDVFGGAVLTDTEGLQQSAAGQGTGQFTAVLRCFHPVELNRVQAAGGGDTRITSYNVCYTKLLRKVFLY